MATAKEVASWMVQQLDLQRELYQEDIVDELAASFGSEFVYENENGNLAIHQRVLTEFRKLTPDVVWERGERMWRRRHPGDSPGRRQVD